MAIVKRFNVNKQEVTLDADIIENMSANDVSYDDSTQYDDNTVGDKLSKLESEVIYDVTANNDSVTFTSLSSLLSSENLSTLIPSSVRFGGMSIRFVNSSDNKYMQYMLTKDEWSIQDSDWEKINIEDDFKEERLSDVINYRVNIERREGINFYTGKYFNTNATNLPTIIDIQSVSCMKISCKSGDTFQIFARASASIVIQIWAFWRENLSRIEKSNISEYMSFRDDGLIITAPQDSAYLTINMLFPIDTDCVYQIHTISKKDIDNTINEDIPVIETQIQHTLYPLHDKKIVCFGDSITEYADYEGKRYSDYIAEITGANVINVGVGGTRIEKRATVVSNPSDQTEAYAALDMMSLIDAVVEKDFTYQFAAVNSGYISSATYLPIVQRLSEIDFDTVDAVTIFTGTNSWRTSRTLGTTGQTDSEYYMLSAVNLIINKLLQAYPKIKIYWFTPMVRWIDSDGYTDSSWCDNFVLNGYIPGDLSLTLAQYKDYIKNEVVKNHIPVCDLYNELGINKFNFWNYFPNLSYGDQRTDGTHPLKGMNVIGRKIASFIMNNLLIPY